MRDVPPAASGLFMRMPWVLALAVALACAGPPPGSEPSAEDSNDSGGAAVELPAPGFHHIHINSVDPKRALDWWATFWPAGERTTVAGMPAFPADGIYLLYNEVEDAGPGRVRPRPAPVDPAEPVLDHGPEHRWARAVRAVDCARSVSLRRDPRSADRGSRRPGARVDRSRFLSVRLNSLSRSCSPRSDPPTPSPVGNP